MWHEEELERDLRRTMVLVRATLASKANADSASYQELNKAISSYLETLFPTKEGNKQYAEFFAGDIESESKKTYTVVPKNQDL